MPLAALTAAGIVEGRIENRYLPPDDLQAVAPDVIVWQRQIEEHQIEYMAEMRRRLPRAHFVYEIDDLLSEVPAANFHAGSIPPDTEAQVKKALVHCDAASVTTPLLASWLKDLGAKHVHVIPNLLPRDKVRKRKHNDLGAKIRVGWGGGMSHKGDLEIIKPAMADIGEEVDWVFLSYKPEGDLPVKIEFHDGTAPEHYTDALYNLDCDLFLAPLEINRFNEAKSNLRLIEAGACSGAVIAQYIPTYRADRPPVFAYCDTPEDWTSAIRRFMAQAPQERRRYGDLMREWVSEKYTFEARIEGRYKAWMPAGAKMWQPKPVDATGGVVVVADATKLEAACRDAALHGKHVLWTRPGVEIDEVGVSHLKTGFGTKEPIAAVMPLSSDGINALPRPGQFTAINGTTGAALNEAVHEACAGLTLRQPLAFGPVVLLRAEVLTAIGAPAVTDHRGNVDAALMEWSARAAMRRLHAVQMADMFCGAVQPPTPLDAASQARLKGRGYADMAQMPSEALPAERREAVETAFFRRRWSGLQPGLSGFGTDYVTWDALRPVLAGNSGEGRINIIKPGEAPNRDIPWTLIQWKEVDLRPDALTRFAAVAREASPSTYFIYGDHEELDFGGNRASFFKPDFDYEYFLGNDYVTPICAVRTSILPEKPITTRLELFELVLRELERRMVKDTQTVVHHIPAVLGSMHDTRPQDARWTANSKAAKARAAIVTSFVGAYAQVAPHPQLHNMGLLQTTYRPFGGKLCIIIPTRGEGSIIQPCVNTLRQHTQDVDYEILVAATAGREPDIGAAKDDPRVRVVHLRSEPFNWAAVNNLAARETTADYLLFLNDDTYAAAKNWVSLMLGHMHSPDVGVVGARLIHPSGKSLMSTGFVHRDNLVAAENSGLTTYHPGYHAYGALSHEVAGVSGTCLMTRASLFREIGGFDENLAVNFNDLAYCMEVRRRGYRVVTEAQADLHHRESYTRASLGEQPRSEQALREGAYFQNKYTDRDPYFSPNFALVFNEGQILGGMRDRLGWDAKEPRLDAHRVLYINDRVERAKNYLSSKAIRRQTDTSGDIVFAADVSGTEMTLTAPAFAVPATWDSRDHAKIGAALRSMGVKEVVLCSLTGGKAPATIDLLATLKRTGIPFRYDPADAETVCPRRNLMQDGKPCGDGYKGGPAVCQECVLQYGSPFGTVDVEHWWRAWGDFLSNTEEALADAAD